MPRITITVEGKVPQPYRFGLDRESVTLGREDNNDIIVDCGSVSMHHAVMQRVHGGYELMDKGSTNGIKLDGEYRQVIDLKNGQAVMLGDVVFDFELSEEELAELAREESSASASASAPPEDPASHLPPLPKMEETPEPAWPEPAWPDDEPEAEAADVPVKRVKPRPTPPPPSSNGQPASGIGTLVYILAVAAFVIGMEIHHRKDTGASMVGRIQEKLSAKTPAAPAKDPATPAN